MFVVNGSSIRICCCVGDFGESAAGVTNSLNRAAVGDASRGVCTQRTVERI